MKNKILILIMLALLGVFLFMDIRLLVKILEKPQVFSDVGDFSYIHHLLLIEYKLEFAVFKLVFTLLILFLWVVQFFKCCWLRVLRNITACYVLFWIMVFLLVGTAIAGVLQQLVGIPINLLNPIHILSIGAGGYTYLFLYVCIGLSLPTIIFVFSSLYFSKMDT